MNAGGRLTHITTCIQKRKEGGIVMGFKDLFLPKIAHSNPEVRKKAVKKEDDQNLLKKVIENDSDPDVRQTAKARLQEIAA